MDVGLKSAGWDSTFSKLEVLLIFASSCESGTVVARVTLMGVRSEQTQRVLVKANTRPVPLRLEFQPEALFSTQSALWLPSKVQVQCTPGHTFDFEFLASIHLPRLKRYVPFEQSYNQADRGLRYNILLLGPAGSGRSSFVNCALTLLDPEGFILNRAAVGGNLRNNTRILKRYPLPGLEVSLWDMWGITNDNFQYTRAILPTLLEGRLPSGWPLGEAPQQHQKELFHNTDSRTSRRIHCMIVFVPSRLLVHREASEGQLASLRELIHIASAIGHHPVVALMLERSSRIRDEEYLVRLAKESFDAHHTSVAIARTYWDEAKRSFAIDIRTFQLLEMALAASASFLWRSPTPTLRRNRLLWMSIVPVLLSVLILVLLFKTQ